MEARRPEMPQETPTFRDTLRLHRRRFISCDTPNPEFTPLLRGPAPVNENISHDFLEQRHIELLEFKDLCQFVRWTCCQWKHRPGSVWFENWNNFMPNITEPQKGNVIFTIRKPFFPSNTSSECKDHQDEKEVPHRTDN